MQNYEQSAKQKLDEIKNMIPEPDNTMYLGFVGGSADEQDDTKTSLDDIKGDLISIYGQTDDDYLKKIKSTIVPQSNKTYAYIILDSENCLEAVNDPMLSNPYTISWYYSYSNNYLKGAVSSTGDIGNIVGLRIASIYVPFRYAAYAEGTLLGSGMTLAFEEFSAQSYISYSGRKFHFNLIQSPTDSDNFTPLQPYFWFSKPITTLDSLTISIGNPIKPIPLNIGRDTVKDLRTQLASVGIDAEFTMPYAAFADYVDGDRVYISGFTTSNPIADAAVISIMNRSEGHLCYTTDPFTIYVEVDISTIAPYPVSPEYSCVIYNPRVRLILNMEVIYQK